MIIGTFLALAVAVVDWIAVAKGRRRIEYFTKPAVMVVLFLSFALSGGFGSIPLIFFGLGILFSLAGDVLLMLPERWFFPGLVAFLLAQVLYIVGFNIPLPPISAWTLGMALLLAWNAARLLRRINGGLVAHNQRELIWPISIYGVAMTVMLLSALIIPMRPEWGILPAMLASLGAFLFYMSDVVLAWCKFVNPIKNGRLINIITYHLGQIALITGVLLQFVS